MKDIQPLFLNGKWRISAEKLEIKSPYDREKVGECALLERDMIPDMIAGLREGLKCMAELEAFNIVGIFEGISGKLRERKEEIAKLMARESGKPVKLGRGEIERSAFLFSLAASEIKTHKDDVLPMGLIPGIGERMCIVARDPLGIVLGISPFNFPMNLISHKMGPALAMKNSYIMKLPSACPLTGYELGKIALECGLPEKALCIITSPTNLVEELVKNEDIAMFSFTGSAPIGWHLKSIAGKKKVALELGGNAGVYVDEDTNIESAASRIALGSFMHAGQICISIQRIFVHKNIYSKFIEALVSATEKLGVGDPLDENNVVGPMIKASEADKIEKWINEAKAEGANILCGNKKKGNVIYPTLIEKPDHRSKVWCEEAFAPLATVEPVENFEMGIDLINDSKYGLQAGFYTRDIKKAYTAFRKIHVGGVIINDYPTFRLDNFPYGGVKDSGFGREGVRYAMDEMSELKTLVVNFNI